MGQSLPYTICGGALSGDGARVLAAIGLGAAVSIMALVQTFALPLLYVPVPLPA